MYYRLFVVLAAALALPIPANAGVLLLTNPNQFSGQETLLIFEGIQPFQVVTSYGGVGFRYAGQPGIGIEGAFDGSSHREFGPQEGTILNQFKFGTQGIQMTFASEINRAAFELRTNPNAGGELSIDLLDAGALVQSFTIDNRDPIVDYLFYGFESSLPFDQVILRGPGDGRFGLDNLRFELAPVPEPGTLTLLGLGALGLMGYRWWPRPVRRPAARALE